MNTIVKQTQDKLDKIVGGEPKLKGETLDNLTLGRTLSWYSNNKDSKDSAKYAKDYLTKQKIKFSVSALNSLPRQFGFVCRILSNGASLDEKNQKWFDSHISELSASPSDSGEIGESVEKKKPNIQDRIADQANAITAELEGSLDDFIMSGCKSTYDAMGLMVTLNTKQVHTPRIIEVFKKYRAEFSNAIDSDDEYIQEAYGIYSKIQMKKLVAFCDAVLSDASKIVSQSKLNRKPRKTKQKTPEQLSSKVKYCKEFSLSEDVKIVSIDPSKIVGSSQVFVYNTKTKKLGVYFAEDGTGISIKGSTLIGVNQIKSVSKTTRKPAETVGEVLSAGKVALRNIMSKLKTKESLLTGRLNADTVILRVS